MSGELIRMCRVDAYRVLMKTLASGLQYRYAQCWCDLLTWIAVCVPCVCHTEIAAARPPFPLAPFDDRRSLSGGHPFRTRESRCQSRPNLPDTKGADKAIYRNYTLSHSITRDQYANYTARDAFLTRPRASTLMIACKLRSERAPCPPCI